MPTRLTSFSPGYFFFPCKKLTRFLKIQVTKLANKWTKLFNGRLITLNFRLFLVVCA